MIPVDSLDDPRIASYRLVAAPGQLLAAGLFVVEGRLVVPRLLHLSAGTDRWARSALSVLLSPAAYDQMRAVLERHESVPAYVVPQDLMDGLVGFNMHRGCLALARRPSVGVLDTAEVSTVRRVVVLEGVNNPDNIGGIFRSAAALGADLVVLGPACADPLYRKSVRTSMGATLDVPYVVAGDWPLALDRMRTWAWQLVALTTDAAAMPLHRFMPSSDRVALLAGAEGPGLSDAALARADVRVTIPMSRRVDSLNVASAVSIALYHISVSTRS